MSAPRKRVLVVDDTVFIRNDLRGAFDAYSADPRSVFTFDVDTAESIEKAIGLIRSNGDGNRYDVLVLDLSFDVDREDDRSGLQLASALGLLRRLGQEIPVEIVFSGFADLRNCVQTMRAGAWDVIDRTDSADGRSSYAMVVESAVNRLRALDLQAHLNVVALKWLQQHVSELQEKYGGQVVAIWHEPEIGVVASGEDSFELEMQLEAWRRDRPEWMYPFVVAIPGMSGVDEAQGAWR